MDFLQDVIVAAQQAGESILSYFYSAFSHNIKIKSDESPVTQADIAANKIINTVLEKITPSIPILSEENNIPDFSIRKTWQQYWLIDPLDGTRGFIQKNPEFCINIALINHHEPILGVMYAPVSRNCFFAVKGQGAFFINPQNKITETITVSKKHTPTRLLTGYFDPAAQLQDRKKTLQARFGSIAVTQMNSALKFTHIARGLADAYVRFGPTSEWDTAAGQCILVEAGGLVVDFNGEPLQYNAKSSLINPSFCAMGDVSLRKSYEKS